MRDSQRLVDTVKRELKRQGKTYADLCVVLDLSHASVKRLFAQGPFTLVRLEAVCQYLGTDLLSMMRQAEAERSKLNALTLEQESELVADERLLCVAHALLNRWSFEEIIQTYEICEHECIRLMAKLDRMRIIELRPNNHYRLLVSRGFRWLSNGPIQQFFEHQVQADFFNSSFNSADQKRVFVSTMLSDASLQKAIEGMDKLVDEINAMHVEDESLPKGARRGVSFVLAARPWETPIFSRLRRT
ncbi:MAG: XRE family transcriptional regulator [Pseudohongiellaceae bacterium]|nr:XRE family transcriptional regulator [Pseudohongiellaceae bacterium]